MRQIVSGALFAMLWYVKCVLLLVLLRRWLCGVVACLLLTGGLSSLRSWLCQRYRQCDGCRMVCKKRDVAFMTVPKTISVIVHKLPAGDFLHYGVQKNRKMMTDSFNSKNNQSAPLQICNHVRTNGISRNVLQGVCLLLLLCPVFFSFSCFCPLPLPLSLSSFSIIS